MLRALDLFCGAGGATKGLQRAGFHVTGVDINPQKRYCGDEFIQGDALVVSLRGYDLIWASPPCQAYSKAQRIQANSHPELIHNIRLRLRSSETPFIIENVPGAPLLSPIELCGANFNLQVYRHRLFECSFYVHAPKHLEHTAPLRKMGRPPQAGEFMHVVGNFSGVIQARKAMDIDWMCRDELREAIPPAYSEHIAREFLKHKS